MLDEGDVCTAARVVLDTQDSLLAGLPAVKVDETQPAAVPTATSTDGDVAVVVTATGATLGDGERLFGFTLPEVLVERLTEPADGACDGLVCLELAVLANEGGECLCGHAESG